MYIYICFSKTLYPEKYPAKLFGPDPGIRNVSRLVKLHSSLKENIDTAREYATICVFKGFVFLEDHRIFGYVWGIKEGSARGR